MAAKYPAQIISLKNGTKELYAYLRKYKARIYRDSGGEKGHVYWSDPINMWLLVMKKGDNAQVTFHAADDCPCKLV